MSKRIVGFFKEPLNLIIAYVILVGVIDAEFITIDSRTKDIALTVFLLFPIFLYFRSKGFSSQTFFKKIFEWPNNLITLYLIWAAVTLNSSINTEKTLLYIAGGFVVYFAGFVVTKDLLDKEFLKKVLYTISLVSLPAVIYSLVRLIIQIINPHAVSTIALVNINLTETLTLFNVPFLSSYFRHPNTFGVILFYSIAAAASLLFLEKRKNFRIFLYAILLLYTPFVFFTLSRAALLAIGAFTLLISLPALKRKIYLIPVIAVLFTAGLTLFVLNDWGLRVSSGTPEPFSQGITTSEGDKLDLKEISEEDIYQPKKISKRGTSNRIVIWEASVEYFKQNPISGAGFGNSVEAIRSNIPDLYARYRGLTPHNTYLRILVESGFVGLG